VPGLISEVPTQSKTWLELAHSIPRNDPMSMILSVRNCAPPMRLLLCFLLPQRVSAEHCGLIPSLCHPLPIRRGQKLFVDAEWGGADSSVRPGS